MKSWQRNKDYEPCITEDAEPRHRGRRAKPQAGTPGPRSGKFRKEPTRWSEPARKKTPAP